MLQSSLKNELSGIFSKDAFDDLRKLIVYLAIDCEASFTSEKHRNRILEKIQSLGGGCTCASDFSPQMILTVSNSDEFNLV